MAASRVAITDTEDITGIAVCGEDRCEGDCGASQQLSDYIFLATKALAASAANVAQVLVSIRGAAFAATAADPFGGGEDIQGIVCFRVGRDTIRVMVARGTTDAGNAAEIAFSDDDGDTWTSVDVGVINGEYVSNGHALFALDRYHIWLGTDGGNIYFSSDAGVTWTLQEAAAISATDIVGISFVSADIGFAGYTGGEVAKTTDGSQTGASWAAVTATAVAGMRDLHAISPFFVWVVGTGGMYYSHDAGVTWNTRNTLVIAAVDFLNELEGIAAGEASSGLIYQTLNGGYDWNPLDLITNTGFLDAVMINSKLSYVSGAATGGTGMLAKLLPEV